MSGFVIIGAGEAGTRAAFALREQGWTGSITLIGDEGGLPYERPPLSKPEGAEVQRKPICDQAQLDGAGIDYRPGLGTTAIDRAQRTVTLSDGRVLPYAKLLLATGARPRKLTCPGAERAQDFRTHDDAIRVFAAAETGARIVIIGAGLIGMELAAVLRSKGAHVDVIEAGPAIMARAVPPHLAARLLARHEAEGVRVHLGVGVTAITDQAVLLADGRSIPVDLVIAAIGVVPRMDLAEGAGLATGNGILTDACLRTSDPDILAAGDCAAVEIAPGLHLRLESWRNAREQAELAACNMINPAVSFSATSWFWSDQYDLCLQVAGLPAAHLPFVTRSLPGDGEVSFYLDEGRLVAAAGLGKGNSVAKDIKLAEMLIAAGARPDAEALADPGVNLKSLLKSLRAA